MHESSAYQLILEEGAINTLHKALLRQGQKRFGPIDEKTTAEVKAIQDLDRLHRLMDAVSTVATWQELLATP